jgi:hypothetical protein
MMGIEELRKHRLTTNKALYRRANPHEFYLDCFGYHTLKLITKPKSLAPNELPRLPQHVDANASGRIC